MDNRPTPKPRKLQNVYENVKRPVPLPRIRESLGGSPSSIESIEDDCIVLRNKPTLQDDHVDNKPESSKGIVKQIQENIISSTKQRKNKVTKSVSEGKKSLNNHFLSLTKKRKNKNVLMVPHVDRCVSMPETDIKLFDSIQFNSPINEQVQYDNVRLKSHNSLSSDSNTQSPSASLSSDVDNTSLMRDNSSTSSSLNNASISNESNTSNNQIYENFAVSSNSWKMYDTVSTGDADKNSSETNDEVVLRHSSQDNTTHKTVRPSQSIMIEFDPLSKARLTALGNSPNLALLESLGTNDDRTSVNTDMDADDFYWDESINYLSPPTPPERLDSLFLDKEVPEIKTDKTKQPDTQSKWFVNENNDDSVSLNHDSPDKHSSIGSRFSSMLKIVPESASYLKKFIDQGSNNTIPSKLLSNRPTHRHQGKMVRFLPGGLEEILKKYSMRPCALADNKLVFYQENSNVKDAYNMKSLFSVQIILSHKFNYDGELHCFRINFSTLGTFNLNRGSVIFGCENETERNFWIRKIVESYTENFPLSYVTQLTRFGWCYMKEGVSGKWDAAWLLLSKRKLFYYMSQESNVRHVDLRKARYVALKEANEKKSEDSGCFILLDQQDITLYLRMGATRETKIWHRIIKAVATNNGSSIHHQQLTKENVPTIVDKCINFIFTQGSLSVGIYRKAGSNALVTQLLMEFRADAWGVQLTARTHSEHDVATALKRFFRDLPDSLLTAELYAMFCAVTSISSKEEKVKKYKSLINNLDSISQNTLKKLIGHLHFIQSLSEENCMTSLNLATVWGPTLLPSPNAKDTELLHEGSKVIFDLIELYMLIYEPSVSDLEREKKMLSVLKQCQQTSNPMQKRSGDLHVWIYLFEKSAGNPVNVVLTPGRTSSDVCLELCNKVGKEYHLLMIEEVVCGDSLRRPLHHTEQLLDVVLRWGYWDEEDRCDNYLVLSDNTLLRDAVDKLDAAKPANLSMELRFASDKVKSFTSCIVEFNSGKLMCSKDKASQVSWGIWNMSDIRWYVGYEPKRNPQSKWAITFIEKNRTHRSRKNPWFGYTIAGTLKEEKLNLVGAFLQAEYNENLIPEPKLIIT